MSSHPQAKTKKKTLAQLRAEKEQRLQDLQLGVLLAKEVATVINRYETEGSSIKERFDAINALSVKANRAYELLQYHPDTYFRTFSCNLKARVHKHLGQHILAIAAYREADELFVAEHRKGTVSADKQGIWRALVGHMGETYLSIHQLEAAKQCFFRTLAWPWRLSIIDRMQPLFNMATYHRTRKDWVRLGECCEEALALFPQVEKGSLNDQAEAGVLIMFADAAEGKGDMRRAHEYDEKAKKSWLETGRTVHSPELVGSHRRDALELLQAGRPQEATRILAHLPKMYKEELICGINFSRIGNLETLLAALKVLVAALVDMGTSNGERIQADVEETEAILAGYWEGLLEDTRWELAEQRRAAERGAGSAEGGAAVAAKKGKAAKRKQQKRKAQQQKAAAAAAAAATRGEEVT